MEARASAKYLRGSAQKARLVVDMIRGKRVGEALAILRFTQKRAAQSIEKCLRSAIAPHVRPEGRGAQALEEAHGRGFAKNRGGPRRRQGRDGGRRRDDRIRV